MIREFIDGRTVFTIVNVPMLAELDRAVQAGEIPEYPAERTVIKEDGEEVTESLDYQLFYQVAPLPALTDALDSRGLSVTNGVVVNPYSSNVEAAKACARYLTEERADQLYGEAGKLTACKGLLTGISGAKEEQRSFLGYTSLYERLLGGEEKQAEEPKSEHAAVYEAYEKAAEVPKIMELSNLWLQLEVVLADIWRGADAGEETGRFLELLREQLN